MATAALARHRAATRLAMRRALATGVVYVRQFPRQAGAATMEGAAEKHGHVYGVWISDKQLAGGVWRMAAVRITTEPVPGALEAIARLPDPTDAEIQRCKDALMRVVRELRAQGIAAMPMLKHPDLFQVGARRALGLGRETRRFDLRTSDTPRYTRGLINGYRRGFAEARQRQGVDGLLRQCEESGDELGFLAECFERAAH